MRSNPILVVGALLLTPLLPAAALGSEVSLSAILSPGQPERLTRAALTGGPAALLASIAGVDSFPIPCATPLLQELSIPADASSPRPEMLRLAQASIASPPSLVEPRTHIAGDGRFAIHFSGQVPVFGVSDADRDRDGLPDRVNRLAEALSASRSFLVSNLGYDDPTSAERPIDVYLLELGHGVEGFLAGAQNNADRFIVLDSTLPADRVLETAFHQLAHASLDAMAPGIAPWWSEATASFLTLTATGDLDRHREALLARVGAPGRSLTSDALRLMQGSLLWPLFLTESTGDALIVRRIWSETAESGLDPLGATELVLERTAGSSLAEAFREQAVWNLFTGERDDAQHYSMGRSLPEAPLTAIGPGLPLYLGPVEPVEPLGSVAFRLPSESRRGALELEVRADGGRPGADLLVFYRDAAAHPVLVPLSLEEGGLGRVSIPWTQAIEAWIVLRNGALPDGGSSRFEISGALDPYAPYDLASFTSEVAGGSILLEWTTAAEQDLIGWNVYRSEHPTGPFTRLNNVAIPAFGDGNVETGYLFVDDGARDGARYYYFLEGLTGSGLAERSHLTSVRTLRRR